MARKQVRGSSRYAPMMCAIAVLLLWVFLPFAGAQQSYRTQQSLHPLPILSRGNSELIEHPTKPPNMSVGRFLGWRLAAKRGSEAVGYFRNLEQRSKRLPSARLALQAAVQSAEGLPRMQNTPLAPSPLPIGLPGVSLRTSLPAGALPSGVVIGDFNGDGKIDWVVANAGDNSLDLYLGNGDGTAQLPIIIAVLGQSPVAVATADLNDDGKLDLVVAEADSQTIGVLFGNGNGTFQPEVEIVLPASPLAVSVADVNGDGHPDLLVGISGDDTENTYFAALLNSGTGQFESPIYAPNPTPGEIVETEELSIADSNHDGIPDVLVTGVNAEGTIVQSYLGHGDGTFTAGEVVDESDAVRDVLNAVLADVDGDGCADVIDVDTSALVNIYPGDCKGDFDNTTSREVYGIGDIGFGLAVADVNGDGHPDIVVGGIPGGGGGGFGTETGDTVTIRLNDGTGHFGRAQIYRGDPGMFALVVADLQKNGHSDVITANQNANTTTVYVNNGSEGFGTPEGGYDGFEEGAPTSPDNPPDSRFIVADINGDGRPDLGLVESAEGSASELNITVMLNQGNGQFSSPIRSAAISSNPFLRVGDFVFANFRKTGQSDFLAEVFDDSGSSAPQLVYAQNVGNGQFGTAVQIPFPTQGDFGFGAISVGDFNNDGNLDFAVATGTGSGATVSQLTVYLGHGDGTFTQSSQVNFGSQSENITPFPETVFVGDANGDGKQDIYVWQFDNTFGSGSGGRDLFEFLGNGDGTFQTPRDVLQNLSAMTMADLNHDGRLDVIDIESGSTLLGEGEPGTAVPQVNVYLGQANGSFGLPTNYTPYNGIFDVFTGNNVTESGGFPTYFGDFNADGNLDVALFQFDSLGDGPAYVQFLMGNGDGTFMPTYDIFGLGIRGIPDLTAPNLLGDGRAALLQTPNYTASYQVLPAANAPSFQIQPLETPVLGNSDSLTIALNVPSASNTAVALSASDAGIQIPSLATIPAGQLSVQVPFTLGSGLVRNRWFSITAQAGGETQIAYDFPGNAIDSFTQVVEPPPLDTVQPGQTSEIWGAGVQSNGDASGTFQTSCQGLPAGISCQFQFGLDTFSLAGNGFQNVLFQIVVSSSTPGGTYTFNVVSTDGQSTLTTPETIQVVVPPPPAPAVALSPTNIQFPIALVGTTQTETVSLSDTGTGPLDISGIAVQSGANGSLVQSNNCGSSLGAGTTCTITVTFDAISVGSSSTALTVTDNAAASPQSVPLSTAVADLAIQAAAGASTTVTVVAGTPAVFSLQLLPNNYSGEIGVTCSGSIPAGNCAVQPASITLNGNNNTPAGFQVTVTSTGGGGAAGMPSASPRNKVRLVLLLALLTMFAAGAAANSRRTARGQLLARFSRVAALLLAGTLLLTSWGCGGGSGNGSNGGNPSTPRGTYVFTVSAFAGGGSRTLQITAVIQ